MVHNHPEAKPVAAGKQARNNTHSQWWKDPGLRSLNFRLLGPMISPMGFGFDAALIGGLLANPRWYIDMKLSNPIMIGFVIASNSIGAAGGVVPAPLLCNWIGRRLTCVFFSCVMIICGIGQAFVQTSAQFIGVRFCLGLAMVSLNIASNLLVAEIAHPRQRAQVTALWVTFFYVGAITVAWTAFGALDIQSSWTWRLLVIMQALWNILQLPFLLFVCPESPRWLALKGKSEEAKALLARFHANGDENDELVQVEFEEIMAITLAEKEKNSNSWTELFRTKTMRKRLAMVTFLGFGTQWVGNSVVNFYLAPVLASVGVTSARDQNAINGGLQIWSWILSIAGALCAERFGRIKLLITSASGMLVTMIITTACSAAYAIDKNLAAGRAVVAFLYLFFGCYCIGFTPIPALYVAEISTPATRGNLVSIYWMCTGLALCFNQFVNPIALAALGWKYYFVYVGVLIVVIAVLYFFFPETKGLTMEEVAGLFDEQAAEVSTLAAEHVKQRHDYDEQIEYANVTASEKGINTV